MLRLTYFITCIILFFCTSCDETTPPVKEPIVAQTAVINPSLAVYTDTLQKINANDSGSIEQATRLFDVLVPNDSTQADSAASALMRFINGAVVVQNERLGKDTADYSALLHPANRELTERQKKHSTALHDNRLKVVSDGEGGIYTVPMYETIFPTVKAKTSSAVDACLDLVAKEDTTPVFLDAGLAIELPELADRLVASEALMNQKLPKQFADEAARLNRFYTNALVLGSDNSPSIEHNSIVLNEEFKKGYDYLLSKYPVTKASAKINVWLAVATSGDKRKIDDYKRTMP
jgi:hypothetical protein